MAFWYETSNGLAEIAVNQGRADRELNLAIGSPVEIVHKEVRITTHARNRANGSS